jgi:hypothetical protein
MSSPSLNSLKPETLKRLRLEATDAQILEALKINTPRELELLSNPPLDINEYRAEKKSQAISITRIDLHEYDSSSKGIPTISDEWIMPYTDEKDLNNVINNFFEWCSLELERSLDKSNIISRHDIDLINGVFIVNLGFNAWEDKDFFVIRIYTGEIPDNKKYLIKNAVLKILT